MVKRRGDGTFDLVLDDSRREVLVAQLEDLSGLLEVAPDHPDLARLSPPAYLEDDEADAAYQLLAGEELRTSHQAAIAAVIESLGRDHLTDADLWTWLQALNSVRLQLGTRLDITDDAQGPSLRALADAQTRSLWVVYDFTTVLQYDIVAALSS